jgi:hypothetical protein
MKLLIAAALAVLALAVACAAAKSEIGVNTIADLYRVCSSSAATDQAYCKGTLDAVFVMHRGDNDPLRLCVSVEGISYPEMLKAVIDWYNAHPDLRTLPAVRGVEQALHGVYPCG